MGGVRVPAENEEGSTKNQLSAPGDSELYGHNSVGTALWAERQAGAQTSRSDGHLASRVLGGKSAGGSLGQVGRKDGGDLPQGR